MNPSTTIITDVAIPAVLLVGLGVGLVLVFAALRWRRNLDALRARLVGGASSGPDVDESSLDSLPLPVARYLRFALGDGRPGAATARLTSKGEFRRGEAADAWIPFKADQVFTTAHPGFVWDARMRMAPVVAIRVVDAYVGGSGTMRAAVMGVVPVVDAPDTPVLAAAELSRWLAETPWLPSALLPGGCVQWEPLDDDSARATVHDGDLEVSADFHFGDEGQVTEVFVAQRPREVDGVYVPTPWSGHFEAYGDEDGVRIPHEAVVQWHLPGGELPYWRGSVTGVRYDTGVSPRG